MYEACMWYVLDVCWVNEVGTEFELSEMSVFK